jgi:hypothetical protein
MVMKNLFLISLIGSLAGTLVLTNPSDKSQYVEHLAFETYQRCSFSEQAVQQKVNVLGKARKMVELQGYKLWFSATTRRPKNYGILTVFQTNSPGLSLVGIGVAGQFLVIPLQELPDCPLPESSRFIQQCP